MKKKKVAHIRSFEPFTVLQVRPSQVLLELCEMRKGMLDRSSGVPTKPIPPLLEFAAANPWTFINPLFWFMQLPVSGVEAIADISMGGEMRSAYQAAIEVGAPVTLIDRSVPVTLFRALGESDVSRY